MFLLMFQSYVCLGVICNPSGVQAGGNAVRHGRSWQQMNESVPCVCKKNVAGPSCARCKPGYYQLKDANPLGCRGEFLLARE
jgi:hypothetical protein